MGDEGSPPPRPHSAWWLSRSLHFIMMFIGFYCQFCFSMSWMCILSLLSIQKINSAKVYQVQAQALSCYLHASLFPREWNKMLLYPFRCTHHFENSEFGGLKDLLPARAFLLVLSLGGRCLLFLFLESKACYCIETCDCLHSVNYGYYKKRGWVRNWVVSIS